MTFKTRVATFWAWYQKHADRFFATIESGKCADLTSEVSEFMEETLPLLDWVFGPGENGGHSFTVTGAGVVARQLLAEYWLGCAPEIDGWTFYGSRQPSPLETLKNYAIQVGENDQVDVESLMLKTSVDDEAKTIDIVAWHPALLHVPEEHDYRILFLLLDETFGEFGTQTWLGDIKIEPFAANDESKPLAELPAFIRQVKEYYEWDKPSPLESYTVYELPDQVDSRRGDTVVGSTHISDVIFDFLEHDGQLSDDPLEGTGAEFAYVAIDGAVFPEGRQSDVRGEIEDALTNVLEPERSGRTLGGATGTAESYIDLLLFDGDNSREIIHDTLASLELRDQSRIESFA